MRFITRLLCVVALALMGFGTRASTPSYDIVIRNGHVIDGTGSPWYAADIAIKDGRIAAIGRLGDVDAKRVIDAHGMVVTPGFIDMLDQSGHTLLVDGHAPSKIFQGVTTLITGEGESPRRSTTRSSRKKVHTRNRRGERSANTSRTCKSKASR